MRLCFKRCFPRVIGGCGNQIICRSRCLRHNMRACRIKSSIIVRLSVPAVVQETVVMIDGANIIPCDGHKAMPHPDAPGPGRLALQSAIKNGQCHIFIAFSFSCTPVGSWDRVIQNHLRRMLLHRTALPGLATLNTPHRFGISFQIHTSESPSANGITQA